MGGQPAAVERKQPDVPAAPQKGQRTGAGRGLGHEERQGRSLNGPGRQCHRRHAAHHHQIAAGLQQREGLHHAQAVQVGQQHLVEREQHQPAGRVGNGTAGGSAVEQAGEHRATGAHHDGCRQPQAQGADPGGPQQTAALKRIGVVQRRMPQHRIVQAQRGQLRGNDVDRVGLIEYPERRRVAAARDHQIDHDAAERQHHKAGQRVDDVSGELLRLPALGQRAHPGRCHGQSAWIRRRTSRCRRGGLRCLFSS